MKWFLGAALLVGLVGCSEQRSEDRRAPRLRATRPHRHEGHARTSPPGPQWQDQAASPRVPRMPPEAAPAKRSAAQSQSPSPFSKRTFLPSLRGRTVVIDAGHGGKDPGTRGKSRLPEKTIVLLIANDVARLLQDRGATVIRTRTTDRFLELDERSAIAEKAGADLFVAIHADSAPREGASGSTVYIARSASARSVSAAGSIRQALVAGGIACRGVQRANYRVLVGHSRPAALVECGFLTNTGDAARLNTLAYRHQVAAAVARGVADHLAR